MQLDRPNKVVVGCLDGRRLKGYVSNLSATRDHFRLFRAENSLHQAGADLGLMAIKAIFFVKDYAGNREHKDAYDAKRKVEFRTFFGHSLPAKDIFSGGCHTCGTRSRRPVILAECWSRKVKNYD